MLPYKDGLSYAYSASFDIASLDFFYPQDAGMTVMNDLLEPKGDWDNPNGGKYLIYSHPALKSGEGVELKVFGEPPLEAVVPDTAVQAEAESADSTKASTAFPSNLILGIGILGGFGLILMGAGVWIWRRSAAEEGEERSLESEDSELADLLTQVIDLEEALEHNQVETRQYLRDRSALNQLIRAEIDQWEIQHTSSGDFSEPLNSMSDPEGVD
jgi:hypothetical protein